MTTRSLYRCQPVQAMDQLSSSSEFGDESDVESSDISNPSISPFSSDDELSEPEAELDESESEVSETGNAMLIITNKLVLPPFTVDLPLSIPSTTIQEVQHGNQHLGCKIVGDNIYKTVKARYMRTQEATKTSICTIFTLLLYEAGLISAISLMCISTRAPSPIKLAESLLPLMISHFVNCSSCMCHVSFPHILFFEFAFEDMVEWHRKHEYYSLLSQWW